MKRYFSFQFQSEITEEKRILVEFIKGKTCESFKLVSLLFVLNDKSNGIANMNNLEKLIGDDDVCDF